MRIPINRSSPTPLYRQIQKFLEDQILSGTLAPSIRLPSSRELAKTLGVSRLTVSNAYAEMESRGLIRSHTGDGVYVANPPDHSPIDCDNDADAVRPTGLLNHQQYVWDSTDQALDDLIASVGHPGIISFAAGSGDAQLFPLEDFRKTLQHILRAHGNEALGYGETAGYPPLRKTISQILSSQGIPVHPEEVIITSGAQQAIQLVFQMLVQPGESVLAEDPTHMGFQDLCRVKRTKVIGMPVDDAGMQVDRVENAIKENKPRLIYTIPNFQNPTGACLSGNRRRQLISLATRYHIPIIEDDYVGEIRYRGASQPAIKALDSAGVVFYIGTFSKMLIPSLRVGYVIAPRPFISTLVNYKHISDVATSCLMQRALEAYITVGRYQAALRRARLVFNRRRQIMLDALTRHMPSGLEWSNPQGGMYIWLKLPEGASSDALFPLAVQNGVLFAPGSFFFSNRDRHEYLRLNFASQSPERIEAGIERLGTAVRGYLGQKFPPA